MREFLVMLRDGRQYTIKADRVMPENQYVTLRLDPTPAGADPLSERERIPSFGATVAMFDRTMVVMVIARENLVALEEGKAVVGPYLIDDEPPIPF